MRSLVASLSRILATVAFVLSLLCFSTATVAVPQEDETCSPSTIPLIDVEMEPSVTTTVLREKISICEFSARCTFNTLVLPNCTITFTLEALEFTGGHDHGDPTGTRPDGTIEFIGPNITGPNGEPVMAKYTAPEEAGIVRITAQGEQASFPNLPPDVQLYSIGFDGLEPLPPSPLYELVGAEGVVGIRHVDNHWGTPALHFKLTKLASEYSQMFLGEKIAINDMSLFSGGLFDLGPDLPVSGDPMCFGKPAAPPADWKTPHCAHRWGIDVDIGLPTGPTDEATDRRRSELLKLGRRNFPTFIVEGDHYHARE